MCYPIAITAATRVSCLTDPHLTIQDTEVGVAWLGTLCQTESSFQSGSTVSGTGVSSSTRTEWSLTSHEIGHNFGAIHDVGCCWKFCYPSADLLGYQCSTGCTLSSACCPLSSSTCNANAQYIMHPTTSSSEVSFSPCTVGNICSVMNTRAVNTSCVVPPGAQTVSRISCCADPAVDD